MAACLLALQERSRLLRVAMVCVSTTTGYNSKESSPEARRPCVERRIYNSELVLGGDVVAVVDDQGFDGDFFGIRVSGLVVPVWR